MEKSDELFLIRLEEISRLAAKHHCVKYTHFLNEKECYIAQNRMGFICDNYKFFGGYDNAGRKMLGIAHDYVQISRSSFPIECFKIMFRKQDILTHRDILGSLMALQIKRETVGDIVIGEGFAYVFCESVIGELVSQINKIGRIGVKILQTSEPITAPEQAFEFIDSVVASLRLDSVVSAAVAKSRNIVSGIIKRKGVQVNYSLTDDCAKPIRVGDIISVRGYGKFILESTGLPTKSGKLHVLIKKYQ